MKKLFAFLFAVFALAVISVSCSKIVKDKVTGLVDEINDSVLVARIDGSKVNFDIREATFTNGAVMYGDSVIIHYIGDLSKKRALAETVYLIERTGVIVEPFDVAIYCERTHHIKVFTIRIGWIEVDGRPQCVNPFAVRDVARSQILLQ